MKMKKAIILIVTLILVFGGVGVYVNYVLSEVKHIVPIYLYVDKKEYWPNETVAIHAKLGTTEYPFRIDCVAPACGIRIYRIPENISPEEVVNNWSMINRWSYEGTGVVSFDIDNSKKYYTFYWNQTVQYDYHYFKALSGYYAVYIPIYLQPDSRNDVRLIYSSSCIFYLHGLSTKIENNTLLISYDVPNVHFSGKVFIYPIHPYNNSTKIVIPFNYTGETVSISLPPVKSIIVLETSIGRYMVRYVL